MSTLRENIRTSIALLESLPALEPQVEQAAQLVLNALQQGHKLLTCGNGGSAADAMHLATEFVCRFVEDRLPFPAICLSSASGDITAIANDYGYDEVFSRQVSAFARPGDVLLVLSTSGNSENVRQALRRAREMNIRSIALLGRGGGPCKGLADIELIVEGSVTARIQEAHKLLLHTLCEIVDQQLPRE